jgi:hypothetical protein
MMTDNQRYGYLLHPSRYDPALGHAGLDIYVADSDPKRFFDTQGALFSVTDGEKVKPLLLLHPARQAQQRFQVVFGRYYLLAHDGDMVEGMCLGGSLEVSTHDTITHGFLTSAAPIFQIDQDGGLAATLDPLVQVELAKMRAEWTGSDAAFDRRLAKLEPMDLFVASLDLLHGYLHNQPQAISSDQVLVERSAVRRAIRTLKAANQWPQSVPTLRELMGWSSLSPDVQPVRKVPAASQLALPRLKTTRPGQPARQARRTGSDEAQVSGA